MTRRAEILAEARTWLGTPFHHQGRLKGVGCDCAGLVVGVARALCLAHRDRRDYPRLPDGHSLQAELAAQLVETAPAAARPGDVLLMRIRRHPQHLAILAEHGRMIHAYEGCGKVVETALDGRWQDRVVAAFRFREVED